MDKRPTFNNAFCCIISLLKLTQAPSVLLDCGLEQSMTARWRNSTEKTHSSKNVRYQTRGNTHTENLADWGNLSRKSRETALLPLITFVVYVVTETYKQK